MRASPGRISLQRLVQVMCENAADLVCTLKKALFARVWTADLVVLNPEKVFTIRAENQHSHVGYTLYEGRTVKGWPEMTFDAARRYWIMAKLWLPPEQEDFYQFHHQESLYKLVK